MENWGYCPLYFFSLTRAPSNYSVSDLLIPRPRAGLLAGSSGSPVNCQWSQRAASLLWILTQLYLFSSEMFRSWLWLWSKVSLLGS